MSQSISTKWREGEWSLKLTFLIIFFASAAWIQVNGIWVELPLLVENSPQQWTLPSYLTVVIQLANIGPLLYLLLSKYLIIRGRNVVTEVSANYFILSVGCIASFVLAFKWKHTTQINGEFYSTWLISLSFLLATVDCMSSVTFLPFMAYFPQRYITIFYIGAGMSGFVPSIAALIQGIGEQTYTCNTVTTLKNISIDGEQMRRINVTEIVPSFFKRDPLFSVKIFFFFITAMLVGSHIAYVLLVKERVKRENNPPLTDEFEFGNTDDCKNNAGEEINEDIKYVNRSRSELYVADEKKELPFRSILFLLVLNGTICGFSNGVLPAIQSYACLPYGNNIYHLTLILCAVINPIACFMYFFVSVTSTKLIFGGVVLYLLSAGYTIGIAATSPCPMMSDSLHGGVIVLIVTVFGVGLVNYLRTAISSILQQQGHKALLYCGISQQLGSLIAALTMFPMVSVYNLFKQSTLCQKCN